MKLDTGNLIFVRGNSPLSLLIRLFDGKYSHCGIIVSENGAVLESQYFINTIIRKLKYKHYDVLDLRLTNEQKERLRELALDKAINFNYDLSQFIWEFLERLFRLRGKNKWNSPKQMICSEILVYLLLQIKWFKEDELEHLEYILDATPNELYRILTKIMENRKTK